MRIVYLLTSLGVGGAEKQALAIAERMASRGHTIRIMALMPRLDEEWSTDIHTVHLDVSKSTGSALKGFLRGGAFLREFRPDLVHSHCFHANIFARLLRFFGPKVVVLSTVHNVYEGGWGRMMAYRFSDGLSSRTVAVSQAAAERFIRLDAVPRGKCTVILNGIDVASFVPSADRREKMRVEMGIAAGSETARRRSAAGFLLLSGNGWLLTLPASMLLTTTHRKLSCPNSQTINFPCNCPLPSTASPGPISPRSRPSRSR